MSGRELSRYDLFSADRLAASRSLTPWKFAVSYLIMITVINY
jgi:hypothetical protein